MVCRRDDLRWDDLLLVLGRATLLLGGLVRSLGSRRSGDIFACDHVKHIRSHADGILAEAFWWRCEQRIFSLSISRSCQSVLVKFLGTLPRVRCVLWKTPCTLLTSPWLILLVPPSSYTCETRNDNVYKDLEFCLIL
jgi:hypothetical protein